jgi:hypothetical protein
MNRVLRTAAIAAFAFSLVLPTAGSAADIPQSDPAAATLLAKHRAFVGWSLNDKAPKTLRIAGEVTRAEKVLRQFETLREGAIFSSNEDQLEGFTGRVFWQADSDTGFLIQPKGESARFRIADDLITTEALTEMPGTIVGQEAIGGVATTIVQVKPDAGYPINVYVDPATGAYERITIDPDGKYDFSYNHIAYADIAGGRKLMDTYSYGKSLSVHHFTKVAVDTAVTASELHPPAPTAEWSFGAPDARIPLRVGENDLHIDATVNGVTGHFLLDTGAAGFAFTDTFARRAHAKLVGDTEIFGIASHAKANQYHVDTVAFGPHTLKNVRIVTGLDESGAGGTGEREDGLIGYDLFGAALVQLDLDDGYMTIQDPTTMQPDTSAGVALNVDLADGTPRVPMQLSGRVPVLATLDSGNSGYMLFSQDVIKYDRVVLAQDTFSLVGQAGSKFRNYGVNGYEDDPCGTIDRLTVGPIAYQHIPACASPSYSRNDVLVGFDFIKHFNYVFDYPDGIIVMTPRKGG